MVSSQYTIQSRRASVTITCGGHASLTLSTETGEYGCCPQCGRVYSWEWDLDVRIVGGVGVVPKRIELVKEQGETDGSQDD